MSFADDECYYEPEYSDEFPIRRCRTKEVEKVEPEFNLTLLLDDDEFRDERVENLEEQSKEVRDE